MSAISGITTAATADTTAVGGDQTLGQDAFLKLLVAQLRYQDPMNPTDSQAFMAQTAQFTTVEKLEEIAASMASLSQNDQLSTIGNLVGKTVQHRNSVGTLVDSRVTAGRVDDNGITLVLDGDDEIRIQDVVAVLAPSVEDA